MICTDQEANTTWQRFRLRVSEDWEEGLPAQCSCLCPLPIAMLFILDALNHGPLLWSCWKKLLARSQACSTTAGLGSLWWFVAILSLRSFLQYLHVIVNYLTAALCHAVVMAVFLFLRLLSSSVCLAVGKSCSVIFGMLETLVLEGLPIVNICIHWVKALAKPKLKQFVFSLISLLCP